MFKIVYKINKVWNGWFWKNKKSDGYKESINHTIVSDYYILNLFNFCDKKLISA